MGEGMGYVYRAGKGNGPGWFYCPSLDMEGISVA